MRIHGPQSERGGMLVNLINISYCAMKLLPCMEETLSQYRGDSVQEFRFALRPCSICIFLFLKNKESPDDLVCHIKTGNQHKTDNFLILFVLPYQNCIN